MLNTLPERIALARREGLDYADFLQIVLADEVSRRDHGRLELRLRQAGFEQLCWQLVLREDAAGEREVLGCLAESHGHVRRPQRLLLAQPLLDRPRDPAQPRLPK